MRTLLYASARLRILLVCFCMDLYIILCGNYQYLVSLSVISYKDPSFRCTDIIQSFSTITFQCTSHIFTLMHHLQSLRTFRQVFFLKSIYLCISITKICTEISGLINNLMGVSFAKLSQAPAPAQLAGFS